MKSKSIGSDVVILIGVLFLIAIVALFALGWIFNIIAICHADFAHLTGMLVVRLIGIFVAPVGAIAGWIP